MKNINMNRIAEDNNTAVRGGLAAKVIAGAAAAVIMIGVPVALGLANKNSNDQTTAAPLTAETILTEKAETANAAAVLENNTVSATASAESGETAGKVTKKNTKKAKKSKKAKKNNKKTNKNNTQTVAETTEIKLPETVIPTNTTNYNTNTNTNTNTQHAEPLPVKTKNQNRQPLQPIPGQVSFVEDMLNMSTTELLELSNFEYEIVQSAHTQCLKYGIRCAAFPDYVFVPEQYNDFSDLYWTNDDYALVVPVNDAYGNTYNEMKLTEKINQIELYGTAWIGGCANVGASQADLEYVLGQDLYLEGIPTSLGLAARAEIDGRTWLLHFDLTEEQEEEIISRIRANDKYTMVEDGVTVLTEWGKAYFGDMNPVCDLAVLDLSNR